MEPVCKVRKCENETLFDKAMESFFARTLSKKKNRIWLSVKSQYGGTTPEVIILRTICRKFKFWVDKYFTCSISYYSLAPSDTLKNHYKLLLNGEKLPSFVKGITLGNGYHGDVEKILFKQREQLLDLRKSNIRSFNGNFLTTSNQFMLLNNESLNSLSLAYINIEIINKLHLFPNLKNLCIYGPEEDARDEWDKRLINEDNLDLVIGRLNKVEICRILPEQITLDLIRSLNKSTKLTTLTINLEKKSQLCLIDNSNLKRLNLYISECEKDYGVPVVLNMKNVVILNITIRNPTPSIDFTQCHDLEILSMRYNHYERIIDVIGLPRTLKSISFSSIPEATPCFEFQQKEAFDNIVITDPQLIRGEAPKALNFTVEIELSRILQRDRKCVSVWNAMYAVQTIRDKFSLSDVKEKKLWIIDYPYPSFWSGVMDAYKEFVDFTKEYDYIMLYNGKRKYTPELMVYRSVLKRLRL